MDQQSLPRHICYHYPYVMLAAALSADSVDEEDASSLRADASNQGICFIHVIRSFEDEWFLVRVAARPELLPQGYSLILSKGELVYTLPWDCRLQNESMTSECICRRLHAYRASHRPVSLCPAPEQSSEEPQRQEATQLAGGQGTPAASTGCVCACNQIKPLPHVFVSKENCQQAVETMPPLVENPEAGHQPARCKTCQRYWLQQVMVRAAIAVVERARAQSAESDILLERLQQGMQRALTLFKRLHRHLVQLSMVFRGKQHIGWWVQVDLPVTLAR